ncbi:hypothetical protein [Dyella flagellata]|uniref:Uncharacterized protein n=1 Tax=Dyella flagellata TaxID=1867833 RepID=A0ABQ5XGH7_9GAMM|nr:hypothetical protein [Dyella flagellata]GLQ90753.1 hypothetical protein GCM10007898_43290 [Dyella flagellata]
MKVLRNLIFIALLGFVSPPLAANSRTSDTSSIVAGHARFEFLTASLVRM